MELLFVWAGAVVVAAGMSLVFSAHLTTQAELCLNGIRAA